LFWQLYNATRKKSEYLCRKLFYYERFIQRQSYKTPLAMSNLLYIVAVLLIVVWATGFFAYNAGSIIHILLVIAIVAVLLRVISGRNPL